MLKVAVLVWHDFFLLSPNMLGLVVLDYKDSKDSVLQT